MDDPHIEASRARRPLLLMRILYTKGKKHWAQRTPRSQPRSQYGFDDDRDQKGKQPQWSGLEKRACKSSWMDWDGQPFTPSPRPEMELLCDDYYY